MALARALESVAAVMGTTGKERSTIPSGTYFRRALQEAPEKRPGGIRGLSESRRCVRAGGGSGSGGGDGVVLVVRDAAQRTVGVSVALPPRRAVGEDAALLKLHRGDDTHRVRWSGDSGGRPSAAARGFALRATSTSGSKKRAPSLMLRCASVFVELASGRTGDGSVAFVALSS